MPQSYSPVPNKSNAVYAVPVYTEAADGVAAFKAYSDQIDYALTPIGMIAPFVGTAAPTGWLMCDGSPYSQEQFPILARLCGTQFGTADAGKFRVPDLRGVFPIGVDSRDTSGDFAVVGKKGGSKNSVLTSDNLPGHKHGIPTHGHTASATGTDKATTSEVSTNHGHTATLSGSVKAADPHQHDLTVTKPTNFARNGSGDGAVVSGNLSNNLTAKGGAHAHDLSTGVVTVAATTDQKHTHEVSLNGAALNIKVNNADAGETGSTGDAKPFLTLGPYMALNFIVRAG